MAAHVRWICLLLLMSLLSLPSWGSTIKLTWEAPTLNADGTPLTDLAGYRLTFCVGGTCDPNVGGTDITPDLGLVTTYLHTGRTPGTDYRYTIRAKDSTGNLSSFSYQAEGRAPPGDLMAWWGRNDSGSATVLTDGSGNGFNGLLCEGTNCNGTTGIQGPTWVTGKIGTALRCDGTNDNVQVAHQTALDLTGDLTISFWLRVLSTAHLTFGPRLITKEQISEATPYQVTILGTAPPRVEFYHHTTTDPDYDAALTFLGYAVPVGTAVTDWHYYTLVRTIADVTVKLYVDGTFIEAKTWINDQPQASGTPVYLCSGFDRGANFFANVDVDEMRLYDYALSQTQITQLAIAPAAPGGVRLP
jgi:hypothetical protein